ncbi:hypothetical protein O6H91_23G025500 [Diphasiastrum complanatum]|uniref:Uncharacterized protein n=1 Tax=Diphasiastrum complanatum TaxID=34168 RepID=A0ACC2A9F8_DIPCM|nr:hypothetical protein O6H91_23G025500 [Diphasiastrum complanatum]
MALLFWKRASAMYSVQSANASVGCQKTGFYSSCSSIMQGQLRLGFKEISIICCCTFKLSCSYPTTRLFSTSPFSLDKSLINSVSAPEKSPPSTTLFSSPPVKTSSEESEEGESDAYESGQSSKWWKPMCLYHTQGLCTYMDNPEHLEKFSHTYPALSVSPRTLKKARQQPFKYFLVLDLEGMVEILEFPIVMLNSETLEVVDRFHRFVKPAKMSEKKLGDYIKGKYGRWGLERVWHDTAIPFTETLKLFEAWLESHNIWDSKGSNKLKDAAFVTCGNWDVKTKIPQQCVTSGIPLPPYFMEWINLKDVYLNFYRRKASGMLAMLKGLDMRMLGTHHVGLDDAHNIARVLQRILSHGATAKITARRPQGNALGVQFLYKNRIR